MNTRFDRSRVEDQRNHQFVGGYEIDPTRPADCQICGKHVSEHRGQQMNHPTDAWLSRTAKACAEVSAQMPYNPPIRKASRNITLDFEGFQGEVSLGIRYVFTPSREPKSDEPGAGASVEILYALVGDTDVMFMLPKEVTNALCESILGEHV